jgi:L-ascorbate metabolism protein UlaG (beta-lactamase superfamily)
MDETVTITFIANTGVLINYKGIRMMLDGIQFHHVEPFDSTPDELYFAMLSGNSEWRNIDYLLFSHEHPNHFSPTKTIPYIEANHVKAVFMPQKGSHELTRLRRTIMGTSTRCVTLTPALNGVEYELAPDIMLRVIATRHMGDEYSNIENYSYFFTFGGKGALFTADAEPLPENFAILRDVHVDVAFINPLFFHDKRGRETLDTVIKPRQVKIYHLPFKSDSTVMYERLARRDMQRYPSAQYDVAIFNLPSGHMSL